MNNKRILLSLCIFAGVLSWNTVADAEASSNESGSSGAVILTVEGRVEASAAGAKTWFPAQIGQQLQLGTRVRTGLRSRASIQLSDRSVLRVNELTTIKIKPPAKSGHLSSLQLEKGETYYFNRERPAKLNFETPLAAGAIRGTEFNLAVSDNGKTVMTLMEGEVVLQNDAGTLELTAGEEGVVEPGKAPRKTAVIQAFNVIQWCLYYPAVLDPDKLELGVEEQEALAESLDAYRAGGLPKALELYPADRTPASDVEKVYFAQLLLSVGQVEEAEHLIISSRLPEADALRMLIAAVKFQTLPDISFTQSSASCLLAASYYEQSLFHLEAALDRARRAVEVAPRFGYAWQRLAELEFSVGNSKETHRALEHCLEHSPLNAQALAVKGFLLAAGNRPQDAMCSFEDAIALDGALGNAWLGRGLLRIYQGNKKDGIADLQVAASLEPNRSLLRSTLGKAFADSYDFERAEDEFKMARELDSEDPTSWLYLALMNQRANRINTAVRNLEKSIERNDNRSLFRSKLLLDQDRAVRSANLAKIYQDAGLNEVGVREASRAVTYDYANYSAHRFLANSYDALRDPNQVNLRYETAWYSELWLSQLLAPVGADNLSRYVSQQEYSRFFEGQRFGAMLSSDFTSEGNWAMSASQYGNSGTMSYALDAEYLSKDADRSNSDTEQHAFSVKVKNQITPQDSVMIEAQTYDSSFDDAAQYYNNTGAAQFEGDEEQHPNVYLGYHHEWSPESHTLLLVGRLDDTLSYSDPAAQIPFLKYTTLMPPRIPWELNTLTFPMEYERRLTLYSAELQHIQKLNSHTLIVGGKYQTGDADAENSITNRYALSSTNLNVNSDFSRWSLYAYDQWQINDALVLIGGITYDRLRYPDNLNTAPVSSSESTADQFSPKAGFIWTVRDNTHVRGAYTRSLGGIYHDNSIRLEPTSVAGFNQAFRSLIPESVVGLVPATEFETYSLGYDQTFNDTYVAIEGQILSSDATRTVGVYTNTTDPVVRSPGSIGQVLDYREKSLSLACHRLLGDDFSVGAVYSIGEASLEQGTPGITPGNGVNTLAENSRATLQRLNLTANFNHPSGFFGSAEALWRSQDNHNQTLSNDAFWQLNLYAGYRFARRRAELRVGLLNLTDEDYRLNPLNLYYELPRERMAAVSFKLDL